MRTRIALQTAIATILVAAPAQGQSLQRVSAQVSGALVFPTSAETDFQNDTRLGWEGQLRYTFSRFSLGAGYQRSTVYKLQGASFSGAVSLGFLEPRYVVAASSAVALYVAGRVGVGSLICDPSDDCAEQDLEPTFGGGGGLLFQVGQRLAIDLGSQFFSTQFTRSAPTGAKSRTGYVLARLGLSLGLF
jgi:hypothetical protein